VGGTPGLARGRDIGCCEVGRHGAGGWSACRGRRSMPPITLRSSSLGLTRADAGGRRCRTTAPTVSCRERIARHCTSGRLPCRDRPGASSRPRDGKPRRMASPGQPSVPVSRPLRQPLFRSFRNAEGTALCWLTVPRSGTSAPPHARPAPPERASRHRGRNRLAHRRAGRSLQRTKSPPQGSRPHARGTDPCCPAPS
jgi:hypothetical protein